MNELIQQLSDQATIRVNNPTVNSNGKVICDNWEEGVSLSKFAELIAQDCISQIALIGISNFENDDIMWAVERSIEIIKERFMEIKE